MKTILVPVDFSATAATAAEFAGNLAIFYNAEIWLYHSYELAASIAGNPFPIATNQAQHEAELEMNAFKKNLQNRLRFAVSIQTKTEINSLLEGLEELGNQIKPDIIVMGVSGETGILKFLVGSNTIKAVHYLKYPVLVIPPKVAFAPVRKIGLACNYEDGSQYTPVGILEKIIRDFNAELHVVNVHPHNKGYKPQEILEGMFANQLLKKVKPEYHTVEAEDVTEGINWFAEEAHLDWIVAIPKKHGLADKIFKHSHTKALLYHSHVPVLCVHE